MSKLRTIQEKEKTARNASFVWNARGHVRKERYNTYDISSEGNFDDIRNRTADPASTKRGQITEVTNSVFSFTCSNISDIY